MIVNQCFNNSGRLVGIQGIITRSQTKCLAPVFCYPYDCKCWETSPLQTADRFAPAACHAHGVYSPSFCRELLLMDPAARCVALRVYHVDIRRRERNYFGGRSVPICSWFQYMIYYPGGKSLGLVQMLHGRKTCSCASGKAPKCRFEGLVRARPPYLAQACVGGRLP